MADLKTLRNRIKGIKNIQKITQAMKVVAASKLRRARMEAEEARLFTETTCSSFLHSLSSLNDSDEIGLDFLNVENAQKTLLVLVSTDRGLCGGLNNNLIKHTLSAAEVISSEGLECKILAIGKKATDAIKSRAPELVYSTSEGFSSRKISLGIVSEIKARILKAVNEEGFVRVRMIFPGFESAMSQVVRDELFIASKDELISNIEEVKEGSHDDLIEFEYEPSKEEVILSLFDYYVLSSLNQAFYETYASEQGSRMSAMDNAVNNCHDMVSKLTLVYNRTRQAKITTELIEIISAVESI
ncbi:MAG: ATP synthase F1 subunit gamma [Rickettsiales bacterium]|jgi:F-type H+-transporting ATPase subunit gamma|nr:ATP synthase F1 subunit gamma [Rickettsiales bacterium]